MCDMLVFCRDGIPPYKLGTKKQLQREMHRSVRINGQITLPHFPVSPTSSSYTSCLCVSFFFCNLLNSNFYTLKDNWVLIPLRSCALFYFYLSLFFPPSELMLCQNTVFHSPAHFHIKVRVNERQNLHITSLLLLYAPNLQSSPHPSSFCMTVNINPCCSLHIPP